MEETENKRNRKNIPKNVQLEVWKRDNWFCRYCHRPVFYSPALKLFNELNPNHQYYHKNGKTGKMLQLFQWSWASVDHITPFTRNGKDDVENYVTACWECNLKYNDKLVGEGKPAPREVIKSTWDGFFGLYKN